ncbi:MAG: hypothetical protein JO145_15085 [Acidobacteriaceae bacterium]|nr:hypothetical protein [Acidobacteriaceae bacterium]
MSDEKALDMRARRAAKRAGLYARRSPTVDNYGGFRLIDRDNRIISGERYDLTPDEILEMCEPSSNLSV